MFYNCVDAATGVLEFDQPQTGNGHLDVQDGHGFSSWRRVTG